MTTNTGRSNVKRDLAIILVLLIAARIIFICALPNTSFAQDVHNWTRVVWELKYERNPYNTTPYLTSPPLVLQFIYGMKQVAHFGLMRFLRVLQTSLIISECLLVFVLYFTLLKFFNVSKIKTLLIVGVSLNPIAIFQVTQQGSFSVVMSLFILLALYFLFKYFDTGDSIYWLYSCLFIGLGILIMTAPVILLPLLCIKAKQLEYRTKLLGALLFAGPALLGLSVVYVLGPEWVTKHVINYSVVYGYFGFTGIFQMLDMGSWNVLLGKTFSYVLYLSVLVIAWKCYSYENFSKEKTIVLTMLLLLFPPLFGPAYGSQCVYWFLPLMIIFFTFAPPLGKKALGYLFVVGVITYIVEYGLFQSHGAFLTRWTSIEAFKKINYISAGSTAAEWITIFRLPLFAVYLLFFTYGVTYYRKLKS